MRTLQARLITQLVFCLHEVRYTGGGPCPRQLRKGGPNKHMSLTRTLSLSTKPKHREVKNTPQQKSLAPWKKHAAKWNLLPRQLHQFYKPPRAWYSGWPNRMCSQISYINFGRANWCHISLWGHIMIRSAGRRVYIALGLVRGAHSLLHQTVISIHV